MVTIDTSDSVIGQRISISGPAVDALDRRKEDNNNSALTSQKLRENLDAIGNNVFAELRKLVRFARTK